MNREIKFRAWHKGSDGYGHYGKPTMLYEYYYGECFRWLNEGQPIEIMQYTGLHDKNGKEIWEGDVCSGTYECIAGEHQVVGSIEWEEHNAAWCFDTGPWGVCLWKEELYDLEVIGDRYSSPELLEEKP